MCYLVKLLVQLGHASPLLLLLGELQLKVRQLFLHLWKRNR